MTRLEAAQNPGPMASIDTTGAQLRLGNCTRQTASHVGLNRECLEISRTRYAISRILTHLRKALADDFSPQRELPPRAAMVDSTSSPLGVNSRLRMSLFDTYLDREWSRDG